MPETHPEKTTTLGILGGGQLGRMSALAAANLGIQTVIFTPETNSPASQVVEKTIVADYHDEQALREFSETVDVISYEFENIPVETIQYLEKFKPVYPKKNLLEVSQDRIHEKSYLNSIQIPTTRWNTLQPLDNIVDRLGDWKTDEAIIKTSRFGYDGKGQARISKDTDFKTLWTQFENAPLIIEEIVDFACEISVIAARDAFGTTVTYGPMLNEHQDHILAKTTVPTELSQTIRNKALTMTKTLAETLDLHGVLTLEFFVTKNGQLLANEIAPRTHNSGHWSIDACAHSQFENHVRAVCGWPVLPPARHSDCEMHNLIGEDIMHIEKYRKQENACIHIYGKQNIRKGRKMGHVTILKDKS